MLEKIPEPVYRAIPQQSQSDCKNLLNLSGMEYQHGVDNPMESSPAMLRGTLAHEIALEGAKIYESRFAIDRWPTLTGKSRTQKGEINGEPASYKAYKAELAASDLTYIKEEEIAQIYGMAGAVHRDFAKQLAIGTPEISLHSIDLGGVQCKGMIDFLPPKHFIFDLKTTGKPLNDRQIWRFLNQDLWKVQAAFYHDLFLAETGESRMFVFLIVSDKAPYSTRKVLVHPDSDCMEQGRERYLEAIEVKKKYATMDTLPGYSMFKVMDEENKR